MQGWKSPFSSWLEETSAHDRGLTASQVQSDFQLWLEQLLGFVGEEGGFPHSLVLGGHLKGNRHLFCQLFSLKEKQPLFRSIFSSLFGVKPPSLAGD